MNSMTLSPDPSDSPLWLLQLQVCVSPCLIYVALGIRLNSRQALSQLSYIPVHV